MAVEVFVDLRGTDDVERLLEQFQGRPLENRMRKAVRAGGAAFREGLRREVSGREDLPQSFRRIRTKSRRSPISISVRPASALFNIFEGGAGPHPIGGGGQLLAGPPGDRSRRAGFVARGPVPHPGMDERPVLGTVFDATHDEARDRASGELFEGLD